jgi:hypothetical protein
VAASLTQLPDYQQESLRDQNPAEFQFGKLLEKFQVHYQFQPMVGRRRVDFLIPGRQLIFVEIDSWYHYQPERIKADRARDKQIYPILAPIRYLSALLIAWSSTAEPRRRFSISFAVNGGLFAAS